MLQHTESQSLYSPRPLGLHAGARGRGVFLHGQ